MLALMHAQYEFYAIHFGPRMRAIFLFVLPGRADAEWLSSVAPTLPNFIGLYGHRDFEFSVHTLTSGALDENRRL